jgi:hypothetical protein
MGGYGSGGHNSKGKLRDVQCARLDVHELAHEGKLKLGTRGWLFGAIWFEVTGGPDAQQLVLGFPRKSANGEPLDPIRQIINCYWHKAHFGGQHLMFLCRECRRSARVLYARYVNDRIWFFSCRKCAGPPLGPLGPSGGEIAFKARVGVRGHRTSQTARNAQADVPAYFGDACLPRGRAKAGGELRSKIQPRSTPC